MRRGLKPMVQRVEQMLWCNPCTEGDCDNCENLIINAGAWDAEQIVIVCDHACEEEEVCLSKSTPEGR